METQAKPLSKRERKELARLAQGNAAKQGQTAETGSSSSVGGSLLDNGPSDPSKTNTETTGGSQTAKATEHLGESTKMSVSWFDAGKLDGLKVKEAEAGAFKTMRQVILDRAKQFSKLGLNAKGDLNEHPQAWLDGFGEVNGKTMKSECRAVLVAACSGPKELVAGYRMGDPSKGEDAKKEYVNKETHTGLEWLYTCTNYAGLIRMARNVKGKDGGGSNVVRIKTKLSDKAFDGVQETLKDANTSQASVIVQAALNKVQSDKESDRELLSIALGVCIRLQGSSKDEAIKQASRKMAEIAQDMIGRIVAAAQQAGVEVKAPVASPMSLPAPAQTAETGSSSDEGQKTGTEG